MLHLVVCCRVYCLQRTCNLFPLPRDPDVILIVVCSFRVPPRLIAPPHSLVTPTSPRRTFFMCKILHRLAVDLGHLERDDEALVLLERILGEDNLVLFDPVSSRRVGKGSLNRLGGVGMSLIQLCNRLSQPPRRWKARFVYRVGEMPERHFTVGVSVLVYSFGCRHGCKLLRPRRF
jgi:hypothetical protein